MAEGSRRTKAHLVKKSQGHARALPPPNSPKIVLPFSVGEPTLALEAMAHNLTTQALGKSAMRPKNRVLGFSAKRCIYPLGTRRQRPELRSKPCPMPTIFTPGIPQWPSRDPLAEYSDQHGGVRAELGTKLYGFVGNSPLNQVDPFGLVEMPDDLDSSNLSWDEIKKQLPGVPCKNPRSKGECCSKARAYFFANPANRGSPSGASVCCDGRLVACNWGENVSLDGYDGPNERLEDFIKKLVGECIVEHELVHVERTENYAKKYPNVACPCDCGILLSQTPTEETDGQECAAHGLSVKCFRKAQKKCAELSDKKEAWICADIMSLKEDNSKKYRNHHCQKVLDSLPPIRVPIYK